MLVSDANCSYVANSLVVTLGSNVKVQMNSELRLLENSKVLREQSDPSLAAPASGKVTLTAPDTKVRELSEHQERIQRTNEVYNRHYVKHNNRALGINNNTE